MKKISKRVLCMALAVLMLASLGAAFAEDSVYYGDYDTYLCLGDSISAGCGVPFEGVDLDMYDASLKYWNLMYHGYDFARVPRCYHDLVATAVGVENFIPGGVSGNRTTEMRYLLDGVYNDTDDELSWGNLMLSAKNSYDRLIATLNAYDSALKSQFGVNFKEAVADADLISLNLGSNDVLSYSAMGALLALYSANPDDSVAQQLLEKLVETGDPLGVFAELLSITKTVDQITNILDIFTERLTASVAKYKENWKAIVDYIFDANPTATVVAVSVYNPFAQFIISDSIDLKLGKILDPVVWDMNLYMKSFTLKYDNYLYADCSDTEIYSFKIENLNTGDYITKVHPTIAGHQHMADQILEQLFEANKFPFVDAADDAWYFDGVKYCYDNGIMLGATDKLFAPAAGVTRAQMAAMLYRMAGSPDIEGMSEPFIDVANSYWAHDAITWAYQNGIIYGVTNHLFSPLTYVSRGQLVTMLYRYAGSPEVTGELSFKDAAFIPAAFRDAIIWATDNGIVYGYSSGNFNSALTLSRAQMAVILERFCTTF